MREPANDPIRLQHILEAIDNILQNVGDSDFETFTSDIIRYHAAVYNIMIIGEATNMLTQDFRDRHPNTPWKKIKGMRNFLVHGYHQVEKDIVWEVIASELKPLQENVRRYLKELNE